MNDHSHAQQCCTLIPSHCCFLIASRRDLLETVLDSFDEEGLKLLWIEGTKFRQQWKEIRVNVDRVLHRTLVEHESGQGLYVLVEKSFGSGGVRLEVGEACTTHWVL